MGANDRCRTGVYRSGCLHRSYAAALNWHFEKYGEHGRSDKPTFYTIKARGRKITVEVVNRPRSYVATAMTRARHLQCLPGLDR
ncbi:DUF4060 family protein [Enterobacter sp.]|uniref:DUF4060 family protein n=1 Tax=Enterobacter sp. TaxID=42895 RepID=UPI003D0BEAD9